MNRKTCVVVRSGEAGAGRQGLEVVGGISRESAQADAICLHRIRIPPGGRGEAHLHRGHETAIYILRGTARMAFGERLEEELTAEAGDFLYIPADMPHLPWNPSTTEECVALVARTDPSEQESVELPCPGSSRRASQAIRYATKAIASTTATSAPTAMCTPPSASHGVRSL